MAEKGWETTHSHKLVLGSVCRWKSICYLLRNDHVTSNTAHGMPLFLTMLTNRDRFSIVPLTTMTRGLRTEGSRINGGVVRLLIPLVRSSR